MKQMAGKNLAYVIDRNLREALVKNLTSSSRLGSTLYAMQRSGVMQLDPRASSSAWSLYHQESDRT